MPGSCFIYGSYGYTGALIANLAVSRGLRPILAGRDAAKLAAQAKALGLETRVFGLDDPGALDEGLQGAAVVIHCAGPFSHTAEAMSEGCLRMGVHYLDITGEVEVFEALAAKDGRARDAGVMLLPGAGFDVVPSDCLAAHLKERLPEAKELVLAFSAPGRPSHGTKLTMIENLWKGCCVRKGGRVQQRPSAWKERKIDFGDRSRSAITITWGDVSTAYHSTGIEDIEVYMAVPKSMKRFAATTRYLGWLMGLAPVQAFLKGRVPPGGPGAAEREKNWCVFWGEVRDDSGNAVEARLRTPDGYTLTAETALRIAERILAGDAPAGFKTPSLAYGADFVLEAPGVTRR